MSVARWLETDTFADKDISSAVAIGVYTADADRMVVCDVSLGSVAGNGDYVIYLTRQINGAGSAYVLLPKTTCTAASGETAIAMQSGVISVLSGDVLTVYVDGLAGDTTTPDTVVRWFEMAALQPTTAGRSLTVDASGNASANVTLQSGVAVAAADANGNIPVVLYGTQPAVTFGQVKIVADVADEGALDIVNSNEAGIAQRNYGADTGVKNVGDIYGTRNVAAIPFIPAMASAGDMNSVKSTVNLILEDTGTTLPGLIAAAGGLDLDTVLETPVTLGEALRVMLAALAGETAGSGTPALTFLGQDGATVRISATVDGIGNRTAVTVDGA